MKTDAVLVKTSFEHVKPFGDAAAMLLTERLFALSPETAALAGDVGAAERAELLGVLTAAVDGLDDMTRLEPALRAIGRYLSERGVQPGSYDRFGDALIWTMGHALGRHFTPEVKTAWTRSYAMVAGLMQDRTRAAA